MHTTYRRLCMRGITRERLSWFRAGCWSIYQVLYWNRCDFGKLRFRYRELRENDFYALHICDVRCSYSLNSTLNIWNIPKLCFEFLASIEKRKYASRAYCAFFSKYRQHFSFIYNCLYIVRERIGLEWIKIKKIIFKSNINNIMLHIFLNIILNVMTKVIQ